MVHGTGAYPYRDRWACPGLPAGNGLWHRILRWHPAGAQWQRLSVPCDHRPQAWFHLATAPGAHLPGSWNHIAGLSAFGGRHPDPGAGYQFPRFRFFQITGRNGFTENAGLGHDPGERPAGHDHRCTHSGQLAQLIRVGYRPAGRYRPDVREHDHDHAGSRRPQPRANGYGAMRNSKLTGVVLPALSAIEPPTLWVPEPRPE